MADTEAFSFPAVPEALLQQEQNPLLSRATVVHSRNGGTSQPKQVTAPPAATSKAGKVPLEAGCSQMDWLRRVSKRTQSPSAVGRTNIPLSEVKQHRTRDDAWTVLRGKVYNISPYLKFHPGGAEMLMRGAGKDCTQLFIKYHAWVNADMLLKADLIGTLDPASADASSALSSSSADRTRGKC